MRCRLLGTRVSLHANSCLFTCEHALSPQTLSSTSGRLLAIQSGLGCVLGGRETTVNTLQQYYLPLSEQYYGILRALLANYASMGPLPLEHALRRSSGWSVDLYTLGKETSSLHSWVH